MIPELSDSQLIELIQQLPPDRKRLVLVALATDAQTTQRQRMAMAEERVRTLCAQRGLDWDALSEEQREALIDELIHEDRACAR